MADGNWGEYLTLLENLGGKLEELTDLERTKALAVGRSDLEELEECMKREQVLSLSLRGYDQKRDAMLAQLELRGVTLSQLEDHSPPELRLETRRTVEELRRQYTLFQSASQVARDTLEINLRAIERLQAAQAGDAAEAAEQRKNHQTDFRA